MKKALFIVFLCSVVMLLSVPQATALDNNSIVNVQVSVEAFGIHLDKYGWNIGVVAPNTPTPSDPGDPFIATNDSTVAADFNIVSSPVSDGDPLWTCVDTGGAAAGENFEMAYNTDGGVSWTSICTSQIFAEDVPAAGFYADPGDPTPEGTAPFHLNFTAPLTTINPGPHGITVTVSASAPL